MHRPRLSRMPGVAPWIVALAPLVWHGAPAGLAAAQASPFAPPPLHVLEVTTRSRWVHSAVPAASVGFGQHRDHFQLRHRPGRRNTGASFTFDRGGPQGSITTDDRNVPMLLSARPGLVSYGPARTPTTRGVASGMLGEGQLLSAARPSLIETRLFEVPLPLPGRAITPGLTWSERTRIDASRGSERESLEIAWRLTAAGDTVLANGERWPVADVEGDVAYELVQRSWDPAHTAPKFIEREGTGRIVGRIVVDTVRGIRAAGADTIRLSGTSTLVMQDGRRFRGPASFERIRTFAAFDSTTWEAEQAQRMAESRRASGGMLGAPDRGDRPPPPPRATLDSLWAAWAAAEDDVERREELERRLWAAQGGGRDVFLDTLAARRLATGDSTLVVRRILGAGARDEPLGLDDWRAVAPFFHDPGKAWRWHLGLHASYIDLVNRIHASDASMHSNGRNTFCAPSTACDAIRADMESSPEPRLREVATAWRFAEQPAEHWTELLRLQESGSRIVDRAVADGLGVGARWGAASGLPAPEDGADWRTWLEWMGGEVRFEGSGRTPFRFYEARTGRDPLADLERRWPDLVGDSARLVIGTILRGSGRLAESTPDEIAADLRSGAPGRIASARRALRRRRAETDTLSAAEAAPFMRVVLDSMANEGSMPWPAIADEGFTLRPGQGFHGARDVPVFVLETGLGEDVLDGHPFAATDSASWADRDLREGGVLVRFEPAQRVGDLLRIRWEWSAWFEREPDAAPEGYAGGEGVWLVRVDDEWRVAATSGWIT